ncbi:MAG: hypothetical protein K8U57_08725 [Planctomycetes bacterium]|nr:hypothetical protein [Planctomycetota bacterium]
MLLADCKADAGFEAFVNRFMTECPRIIQRNTIAFFGEKNRQQLQCGSGVLLEIGGRHFILTAAHVLDLHSSHGIPLWVMPDEIGKRVISLDGAVLFASEMPESRDRRDDPMDAGFLELPPQIVSELLPSKEFLPLRNIDIRDPFRARSWYMTVGYPYEVNLPDHDRRSHTSTLFAYASWPYTGERGMPPNFNPGFDLLVHYMRNDSTEGDESVLAYVPEPPGVSGCGMWRLAAADKHIETWTADDIRLVGIQHSWQRGLETLRGVRAIHPLRMLALSLPELMPFFQLDGM